MNVLLVFFALPVATIILAIVLQKILKCPLLVGATFFEIFLIVVFVIAPNGTLLIYAILYSILAYVTAVLTCIICKLISRFGNVIGDCTKSCNICGENNSSNFSNPSGSFNLMPTNNNCNAGNNVATVRIIDSRNNNCLSPTNSVTTVTTTSGNGPLNTTSNTFSQGRGNTICTCGRTCGRR